MYRVLLSAVILFATAAAHATEAFPDHLVIRYSVKYGAIPLGIVTKTLVREGTDYRLTSDTKATGIGRLFTDDTVKEEGVFRVSDHRVQPLSYRQVRDGKKAYVRTVKFDWQRGVVVFNNGREEKLPAGTQDSGTVLFALMLAPVNNDKPQEVHLTDGKGLSRYTYQRAGEKTLDTPIGKLNTILIQRRRPDKKEVVSIYLATAKHNLPVKIVKERGGKPTTTLLIDSLQGL
jgi:hypothetical protein